MQSAGTTLQCPNCGQPFSAILEQIVDAQRNPQAKVRLLNGQLNLLTCPHCSAQFPAYTPLIYHDASSELLITFIPMELNLPKTEQEKLIGQLQNALINTLPSEERKGYLFTPRTALTMQSLVEQVMEADGITPEMREAHQARLDLIDMLLETSEDQRATIIQAHDADIDEDFIRTLATTAELFARRGNQAQYQKLVALYEQIVEHSSAGRELAAAMQRQEEAIAWAQERLNALGEEVTREQLLDLVIDAGPDDDRLQALVGMAWMGLDYQFFQMFSSRLEAADGEERARLEAIRSRLLELTELVEQQNRAVLEQSAALLRELMQAPDLDTALRQRLSQIDEVFLSVLAANIQAAEQAKDINAAAKLKQIYERALDMLQADAPPEVRFVNALMLAETEEAAQAIIQEQAGKLGPKALEILGVLIEDLRAQGNAAAASRIEALRAQVAEVVQ